MTGIASKRTARRDRFAAHVRALYPSASIAVHPLSLIVSGDDGAMAFAKREAARLGYSHGGSVDPVGRPLHVAVRF